VACGRASVLLMAWWPVVPMQQISSAKPTRWQLKAVFSTCVHAAGTAALLFSQSNGQGPCTPAGCKEVHCCMGMVELCQHPAGDTSSTTTAGQAAYRTLPPNYASETTFTVSKYK